MTDTAAAVAQHTTRLLDTARALPDATAPSLCEGWTRGHVLSHVARNAEAIGRLADWAVSGTRQEMYPGGAKARNAEIEAGAGRSLDDLVTDVSDTATALAPRLGALSGELAVEQVEMRGGLMVSPRELPFLRLRELVFHHVDLDAGFGFADVEPDLLLVLLEDAVRRLAVTPGAPSVTLRTDEGETWTVGEGSTEVGGTRAGLLLWLARRIGDEVRPAGVLPELPRGA